MPPDNPLSETEKHNRIQQLERELRELKSSLEEPENNLNFDPIYEQVFHRALQGNVIIINGRIAEVNQRMSRITGYSSDEYRQMSAAQLNEMVHPDDLADFLNAFEKHSGTTPTQPFHHQYRIIRKDGQIRWLDVVNNLFIVNGVAVVHSCSVDITAERQSNETVHYQSFLLENISDAVISCDTDFYIKSWNTAATALYGWTEQEVLGKQLNALLHVKSESMTLPTLNQHLAQEDTWKGEFTLQHKNGKQLIISTSISLLRDIKQVPIGIVAVHRDITQLKQIEADLEQLVQQRTQELQEVNQQLILSEGRYRTLIHHFPNGIVGLVNPDLTFDLVDGKGMQWTNIQVDEVKGKRLTEIFGEEIAQRDEPALIEALSGKQKEVLIEYGDMAFRVHTLPIKDEADQVSGAMLMTQNVSELKQAERALRESEQRYRSLLESISDAIFVVDLNWQYVHINSTAEAFLEQDAIDLIGRRVIDIFPFFVKTAHYQAIQQAMDKRVSGFVTEKFKQADKSYRWYKSFVYPTPDGILVITRDTTYEHELEEQNLKIQLAQNQAKALDELIHNLSHDLRTPLSVIHTSLYLMENYKDPQRQQAKLQSIKKQAHILEKMLSNILLMTQLDQLTRIQAENTQLNQILHNLIAHYQDTLKEKSIELHSFVSENPIFARIHSEYFYKALLHLFENAIIYTPPEGQITLRMTQDTDSKRVAIEIIDSGIGITEEDMPRVFERFYRANRARTLNDTGSGLGLTLANKIMNLHGGRIHIDSKVGEGTTLIIYL